jgi:MOSC domain-containing protein YiiM
VGNLVSIVYKPDGEPLRENGFTRIPVQEARLVEGHGIEGDLKGGSEDRHLNIMAAETVRALEADGFRTRPGQLGEQLVIDGLHIDELPVGTVVRIGSEAAVELVRKRTGCNRFEAYQDKTIADTGDRVGMMAKVKSEGTIRVGDSVSISS